MTSLACSNPVYPLAKVSPWDAVRTSVVDQPKEPLSVL